MVSPAELLLQSLGITEPSEIDLEAIAYHVNARIKMKPLTSCEARIIGLDHNAIITVNTNSSLRRRRFSIAHELGHWFLHRGKRLSCRAQYLGPAVQSAVERSADQYAADLLMPQYLFRPIALRQKHLTFESVAAISNIFETSKTATAIRLVKTLNLPAALICHGPLGRKWFVPSATFPTEWFPRQDLDASSSALSALFDQHAKVLPQKVIGAQAWFDRHDAAHHMVKEQCLKIAQDEVLTFIQIC